MKIVYRPADTLEGHIVCNMLIAQGIDAHLQGEYQQGGVGELMPSDFSSIEVPEEQLAAAEMIMNDYHKQSPTPSETGSKKNNTFVILLILLMLFISISIFFKLIFKP